MDNITLFGEQLSRDLDALCASTSHTQAITRWTQHLIDLMRLLHSQPGIEAPHQAYLVIVSAVTMLAAYFDETAPEFGVASPHPDMNAAVMEIMRQFHDIAFP